MDEESATIPSKLIFLWLFLFFFVLIWSAIHPHDLFTWFLEVLPALVGLVVLAITFRNFRFTRMAYWLMLIHSIILMIGGHYTYAEVPFFIVVCICLAMSVGYEFIEWWVAVVTGTAAESFLGTQGYVWDTQSDMFMAFVGAIAALSLLSKLHERELSLHLTSLNDPT